jgi:deoxyribonuclease-4
VAGGLYKAVERGEAAGCDCIQIHIVSPKRWPQNMSTSSGPAKQPVSTAKKPHQKQVQVFTKTNNQRKAEAIPADAAEKFRATLEQSPINYPLSHSSYLINLGTADAALWKKSIDAFVVELQRAELLGIPHVVLHPGAHTKSTEEAGIAAVISALDEIHSQTRDLSSKCLLETTAGQGTTLGWRFEQLAEIVNGVQDPDRLGICLDTCHVFAAGYALSSQQEYRATMKEFDQTIGLDKIGAIHLNDSKRELGSRIDRHENIGQGHLGEDAFANLLTDSRFGDVPMYLETPKGTDDSGEDLDVVNLARLRCLARS